jgi:hypothetical protein
MSQGEIVGPAASGKLIPSIQPHNRPGTTLNSFGRCLKIIDTFRSTRCYAEFHITDMLATPPLRRCGFA